jgi:hypothetical protein
MGGFDPITAITGLIDTGIKRFTREKMSEKDQQELSNNMTMFVMSEARQEGSAFRSFVLAYEGEAKDYKDIPLIGPIMMLIRGLIRPGFTLGVAYWDWCYFTAQSLELWTHDKTNLLFAINLIVLIFWFGERTVQYVMPLINAFLQAKTGQRLDGKI